MRAAFVGVPLALALGCATAGSASPGESRDLVQSEDGMMMRTTPDYATTESVGQPLDEAYAGLLLAYQKLGIEATTNDPVGHHVGNTSMTVVHRWHNEDLSRFFECGRDGGTNLPRADHYRITFSVVSSLVADGKQETKIETMVTARGTDTGAGGSVYCSTTGHLEALLIETMAK